MTAKLTAEQQALVAQHADLPVIIAKKVAKRYRLRGKAFDVEDLSQEGVIGLIIAARRFVAGRGAHFRSFAQHHVHGAVIDSIRSRLGRSQQRAAVEFAVSAECPCYRWRSDYEPGRKFTLKDSFAARPCDPLEAMQAEDVLALARRFGGRDAELLLAVLEGRPAESTAGHFGTSQSGVSIKRRALMDRLAESSLPRILREAM
jgi:RNA polymerase sigma factor (sigma-70 family)